MKNLTTEDTEHTEGVIEHVSLPGVELYCGDCRDILPLLAFDAIITDPPYGIGFASQPTTGGRRRGQRRERWDDETPSDVVLKLPEFTSICAIWGGNYYELPCTRGWLVWRKPDAPPSMAHGELAWTNQDKNLRVIDWSISATNPERVGHPTQKPVRVMTWTMEQVGVPDNATVIDPFMGSGSTIVAAIRTGRKAIGIEKDPEHFKTAVERIKRELAQGDLFLNQKETN
jgi:site-specific DNA-methyltransferase (adenine-specific)/modification methylase